MAIWHVRYEDIPECSEPTGKYLVCTGETVGGKDFVALEIWAEDEQHKLTAEMQAEALCALLDLFHAAAPC